VNFYFAGTGDWTFVDGDEVSLEVDVEIPVDAEFARREPERSADLDCERRKSGEVVEDVDLRGARPGDGASENAIQLLRQVGSPRRVDALLRHEVRVQIAVGVGDNRGLPDGKGADTPRAVVLGSREDAI